MYADLTKFELVQSDHLMGNQIISFGMGIRPSNGEPDHLIWNGELDHLMGNQTI